MTFILFNLTGNGFMISILMSPDFSGMEAEICQILRTTNTEVSDGRQSATSLYHLVYTSRAEPILHRVC